MYSHVLAAYQKALLVFWAKTAKTMAAVAESFKGYQYYEFTVIKDLAEPSRLLAEMNSSSFTDKNKDQEKSNTKTNKNDESQGDDSLINIGQSDEQNQGENEKKNSMNNDRKGK